MTSPSNQSQTAGQEEPHLSLEETEENPFLTPEERAAQNPFLTPEPDEREQAAQAEKEAEAAQEAEAARRAQEPESAPVRRPVDPLEELGETDETLEAWAEQRLADHRREYDREHGAGAWERHVQETVENSDEIDARITRHLDERRSEYDREHGAGAWERRVANLGWRQPPPTYQDALGDEVYRPGPEELAAGQQPGRGPEGTQPSDTESVAARREERELERRQSRESLNQGHESPDPDHDLSL